MIEEQGRIIKGQTTLRGKEETHNVTIQLTTKDKKGQVKKVERYRSIPRVLSEGFSLRDKEAYVNH